MVSYGPWIDPPEDVERIRLSEGLSGSDAVRFIGDVRSGIVIDWVNTNLYVSTVLTEMAGAPDVPIRPPSAETWGHMLKTQFVEGVGIADRLARVYHTGNHAQTGIDGSFTQTDSWRFTPAMWDIWQAGNPTPPTLPPGAIDVQYDGPLQPVTLTGLTLRDLDSAMIPQWGYRVAPTGHEGRTFGLGDTPETLRSRSSWPSFEPGGDWVWMEDELAAVQSLLSVTSADRPSRGDVRWPAAALLWQGDWPGADPVLVDAHGPYVLEYVATPILELEVRFRRQRHRFVYWDEPEPIRQTWARDDHRAGGAVQTWPESKAQQSGNRTWGGYL